MLLISTGVGDENNAPPSPAQQPGRNVKNNRECDRQEINGGIAVAEPYRYVGWLLRNDASARDKGGRTFVRQGEN
ncbi:hypothetical protein AC88_2406 [Escherichia coli 3-267-03_S4_C1]|nr:hypothetical protein AD31_2417 [Escherichia coli 2-427-07_S4_C3]KEJ61233.1 hypothetical protein AC88_2406 [Escherichia coli 3-267-03_S4_C1]KEN67850.1 hypothetical protein AD40_2477 [Escherichia coli 1-392-07_S4_C3]